MNMDLKWVFFFGLVAALRSLVCAARRPYVAAAFEHARFGSVLDSPSLVVQENIRRYKKAAQVAASKGTDIIVYPEYGIFYSTSRDLLKPFLEDIPDPKKIRTNPCEERELYVKRPILYSLSCIAKENAMVVVANMGDIKNCSTEIGCPSDGVFHFNTNVVFDKNGTILVRYHKEHLFFEIGMDVPKEEQDSTFKTEFGTFATYICFDIIFSRMSEVAKWPQVDGVMFSTMWIEAMPQFSSVSFQQGWAIGNNATFVAANLQIPASCVIGSGIYDREHGFLRYTYNPDGISKLIVAEISPSGKSPPLKSSITAIDGDRIWDWKNDGEDVPKTRSKNALINSDESKTDLHCRNENTTNYTLIKLTKPSGYVKACHNGMCCSLKYSAEQMTEDYYLGVYNGTYNSHNRYVWCEENCFIARCDEYQGRQCSTFPRIANTVFHYVKIRASFSTPYIYPSVVSSKVRLVPRAQWKHDVVRKNGYESSIYLRSVSGQKLINAGFKARCYDRDPPYVRSPSGYNTIL